MISLGIDELLQHHTHLIENKRVALISHYSMTNAQLIPVIDCLAQSTHGTVVRLFGPEHGVLNAAPEGASIAYMDDPHSGLPAYSLYGDVKAPTPEMLNDIDVLVIDLQDIGTRYYTNPSTLYYVLLSAAASDVSVIVLDRPNPLGGLKREGHLLDPGYESFVGMIPVPIRHGLTLGELALFIQARFVPTVALHVVAMTGWSREMMWPKTHLPFVSASPNTTHFDMTLLYPGTCLFEGTNVSLGRGTTHPFEWIGAPWADGHRVADWYNSRHVPGVVARPVYFNPWRSLYSGQLVHGVQLHVIDPDQVHSLHAGVTLLNAFQTLYPDTFRMTSDDDTHRPFFDLLAGGARLRQAISDGTTDHYFAEEPEIIAHFKERITPYLIYQ